MNDSTSSRRRPTRPKLVAPGRSYKLSLSGLWKPSILTYSTFCAAVLILGSITYSFLFTHLDPKGCAMAYMRPSYVHLEEFNSTYSPFADKYSLHFYRESGVHQYVQVQGTPVLFIPGNAGSYKQARSWASQASYHYQQMEQLNGNTTVASPLDFFSVDFNEDFTAFHGQTLLDQALYLNEAIGYILSLYDNPEWISKDFQGPKPISVILIGHSMGGMVARTLFTMPNYRNGSVNTIFTLATPHSRSPASFDGEMVHVYQRVNAFWKDAYLQPLESNCLHDVTVVSIAGGTLDTTVPSDYSPIDSIIPPTHGFQVYTTAIPSVWTSMDHLAITWCDQLRKSVIRYVYDIIDLTRKSRTKPAAARMKVLSQGLLPGFSVLSDAPPQDQSGLRFALDLNDSSLHVAQLRDALVQSSISNSHHMRRLLPCKYGMQFELITNKPVGLPDPVSATAVSVLLCSASPPGGDDDLTSLSPKASSGVSRHPTLVCHSVHESGIRIPISTQTSKFASESSQEHLFYMRFSGSVLSKYDFVAVLDSPASGFLTSGLSVHDRPESVVSHSLFQIFLFGIRFSLDVSNRLLTSIRIPAIQSGLLAYKLRFQVKPSEDSFSLAQTIVPNFAPILRQFLTNSPESKFFVHVQPDNPIDVHFYGKSPYLSSSFSPTTVPELGFQLWVDPDSTWRHSNLEFDLRVDYFGSLGQLWMRYRTLFAVLPLSIVALTFREQLKAYYRTEIFLPFLAGLEKALRGSIPAFAAFLICLHLVLPIAPFVLKTFELENTAFFPSSWLLGTDEPEFGVLIPIFLLVAIGMVILVHYAVFLVVYMLASVGLVLKSLFGSQTPRASHSSPSNSEPFISLSAFLIREAIVVPLFLAVVPYLLPYPFAYFILCLIHLGACVSSLTGLFQQASSAKFHFFNYGYSTLMLMVWLLPCNLPVLLVWTRNLLLCWQPSFPTHHGWLSMLPYLVVVEIVRKKGVLPKTPSRSHDFLGSYLVAIACIAALVGVDQAYTLHYHHAIVFATIAFLHLSLLGERTDQNFTSVEDPTAARTTDR